MPRYDDLDKISISVKSHRLLKDLLKDNPKLNEILRNSKNETEVHVGVKKWILQDLKSRDDAYQFYLRKAQGREAFNKLTWQDYAAIRILDYIDFAGKEFVDQNLRGNIAINNPIRMLWLATNFGTGGAKPEFFYDMLNLFRQFSGQNVRIQPTREKVVEWMSRYPSGLDQRIVALREENRDRILNTIIDKLDSGEMSSNRYKFTTEKSKEEKCQTALKWWGEMRFHLKFAVRDPDLLNEMLGMSLDPDTMKVLYDARDAGIPFFLNPYYISLLHVRVPYFAIGADMAIRHYVLYNKQLVKEFGHIVAWEKEDEVTPGKPNAAGWLLPSQHNLHRRYPDVAILIPQTMGRACGGLCSSCQRMYDFQSGNLNFNLSKLNPDQTWASQLKLLMKYFEEDSQLRDILITGGDALMNTDSQLEEVLNAVLEMAKRKKEANKKRKAGKKYAEILRVRLGSRLLAYLPQRITPDLVKVLAEFKAKASKVGIRQFVVQTHFESPMEITPDSKVAIELLNTAGWIIINQHVFTTASSRRGHAAKLRSVLNDVGILPYYTFTVKGYMENYDSFAPNARSMQEQIEEKSIGAIPPEFDQSIADFPSDPENICKNVDKIRVKSNIPFLAMDRNVLNLPGVGKSLTFRVVGITRYGRRILEFDHDATRRHSPIIEKMGKVYIIESKAISDYIEQLESLGEDPAEFDALYGYSIGETESRASIYNYPEFDFKITDEMTNLSV